MRRALPGKNKRCVLYKEQLCVVIIGLQDYMKTEFNCLQDMP